MCPWWPPLRSGWPPEQTRSTTARATMRRSIRIPRNSPRCSPRSPRSPRAPEGNVLAGDGIHPGSLASRASRWLIPASSGRCRRVTIVSVTDEGQRYGGGWLLGVLLAGQFIANVDTAIVNIAVPSIAEDFPASPGQLALVGAGYLVAYAVLLVTGARLGSLIGTRPVFLGGLLGFTVASLACGLAPGIGWLVAARVAQGAGAALMVPQVLSGIQRYFSGTSRVRALGYYAVALS